MAKDPIYVVAGPLRHPHRISNTSRAPLSPPLVSGAFAHTLTIAVLVAPTIALAAPHTFQELAALVVSIFNSLTSLLIVAGIVVYFYGISINILKFGEGEAEKLKNYFFWGIIVLFVMVSIWGILSLLQQTLFGSGGYGGGGGSATSPDLYQPPKFME